MTGLEHPLVRAYLARLDTLSASLPPDRRAELRADIEDHLREATSHSDHDDTAVSALLARLGPPEDVVAEAGGTPGPPSPPPPPVPAQPRTPRLEAVALTLLILSIVFAATILLGVFALPMWLVGIVLLVVSSRWSVPDKVVGGIAYGLLGAPLLFVSLTGAPFLVFTESCLGGGNADGTTYETCTGGPPSWWGWFLGACAIGLVALWVWAGRRLLRSARRPQEAAHEALATATNDG